MSERYQKMKKLKKDLVEYNREFLPEYEKFLSEFTQHLHINCR
jgi:hypothetical protein